MIASLIATLFLGMATGADLAPLDVETEDLQPGLLASYRSLVTEARLARVEAKPAFYLGESSPHPRLPPGPFEVLWTGVILLKDTGSLAFDAHVAGEVQIDVGGKTVLRNAKSSPGQALFADRSTAFDVKETGLYRISISYRAPQTGPAGLQIWWQGATFSPEPLPAWQLKRLAKEDPPAAKADELAGQGRILAGRLGCARCHAGAMASVYDPPPGPSLADVRTRIDHDWMMHWLAKPRDVVPDGRMPELFDSDRNGHVERWLVAEYLLGKRAEPKRTETLSDHRAGRLAFIGIGCAACHAVPDLPAGEQPDLGRTALRGLADKFSLDQLSAFLGNPHSRYPDGRMPRLPVAADKARDIAVYLLKYSPAAKLEASGGAPTPEEIASVLKRLQVRDPMLAGKALVEEKKCVVCHPGLDASVPVDLPLKSPEAGCLSHTGLPRYRLSQDERDALRAYLKVARHEKYASPFDRRQHALFRAGCVRCHQRDSDRPPAIEVAGSTLGGGFLQDLPFQRTPRLSYPHQKFERRHLSSAVREGVTGLRPTRFTYRMPAFGEQADVLVQALAEADGEFPLPMPKPAAKPSDPTLGPLSGSLLAGFQGYSCVSCHIWNGQAFSQPDPGAVGTDLTRVAGRIRRDWFDRFLENPGRLHPGTPMPAIFQKGKPATLTTVLEGDPARQKEALWSYFALGKEAPAPKPAPPLVIPAPAKGESPLVAQIPLFLPGGEVIESIAMLYPGDDLLVYDIGKGDVHSVFTGGQILRQVQARVRKFLAAGTAMSRESQAPSGWTLIETKSGARESPATVAFRRYDRLADGVSIHLDLDFPSGRIHVLDTFRLDAHTRTLRRDIEATGIPKERALHLDGHSRATLRGHPKTVNAGFTLPVARSAPIVQQPSFADSGSAEGSLERPGYRAVAYPRPKTASGEDLVMPSAIAVDPRNGKVFVASMKLGDLFVIDDPDGNGKKARFRNYARGLFEEAYGMLADKDGLFVLHRRNLTKLIDRDGDGTADRFERVLALPHGLAATYDYAYGLARDRSGAFVYSFAPYANRQLPGSGSAVRHVPGQKPEEIAFGFRNPFGWCAGPEGEVFFSDNQGEWVATNKLSHLAAGRFYGFPNTAQKQHASKPPGKAAVWVPYAWARSINGIAHDNTGGKFGPFDGQIFLAELMFGGAVLRANLEKVNGEFQGACFPFWGKGLLGPLSLAFDPRGHLYVGGITEPGWMAQPDRGALFRIDYTGQIPFEMQSIHVQPRGFRIVFTSPVVLDSASKTTAYQVEHYRYELSGAYGSPELDRTKALLEKVEVAPDGRSVELRLAAPLVRDRVYMIGAAGVRSVKGDRLVHPAGAYTLNEIPK